MNEMATREKVSFLTKKKVKKRARREVKKCPRCKHWTLMKAGKISCDSPKDTQVWFCKRCGFRRLRRVDDKEKDEERMKQTIEKKEVLRLPHSQTKMVTKEIPRDSDGEARLKVRFSKVK